MQEQRPNNEYWNGLTDYGRGHEGESGYAPVPEEFRVNGMSKACLVFGILSLAGVFLGFSFPLGALGLLFGFLSRDRIFSKQAKTGMILSSAGMAAFVVSVITVVVMFITTGLWDYAVDRIRKVDPSDPVSVAMAEQDILNKVLEHYGLSSGASPYGSLLPGSSGGDGVSSGEADVNGEAGGTENTVGTVDDAAGTAGGVGAAGDAAGETGTAGEAGTAGETGAAAETGGDETARDTGDTDAAGSSPSENDSGSAGLNYGSADGGYTL